MNSSRLNSKPLATGPGHATAFISTAQWASALAAERRRLEADLARLRERVANLGLDDPDGAPAWSEGEPARSATAGLAVDDLIELAGKLAPALAVMGRLRTLLQDPRVELQEVVNVMRLDPALTLRVIQMSNSVLFGARVHHDSIEHAAGRLGFSEIYRLVGLAATRQLCQHDLKMYGLPAATLWEATLATAAAAEVLARQTGSDAGLAYTAGLFRTLGQVMLDSAGRGRVYPGAVSGLTVSAWEKETFGLTATEVTVALLTHWKFPAEIIGALRGYHNPLADSESNVGACVLNLACGLAARAGCDLPGEADDWVFSPATLTLAGLTEADLELCAERAQAHFAALCATAS